MLQQREDILATTSASSIIYATLDGWRRQMAEQGTELLGRTLERARRVREQVTDLDGLRVMGDEVIGSGGTFELDPLKVTIEVADLGITGYQATEWLRAHCHVDLGSADTIRMQAALTHADDDHTERLLLDSLCRLVERVGELDKPPRVRLPVAGDLELENAMSPRDAFFAQVEQIPAEDAVGRIAAELISPYPPGVPVLAPGEVITKPALDYLISGVEAGMLIPDAADASLKTFRVVAR